MIGKRKLVAEALFRLGVFDAWPERSGSRLVVFNYHRLYPGTEAPTEFDDGVFGPTAQLFDAQLDWLKRHCNMLSEQDVIDAVGSGHWPRGRNVMITFDDAYREQYTVAWPLVRAHGVPAMFFVPTRPIAERSLGWWDLIAWLLKHTRRDRIELDGTSYDLREGRAETAHELMQRMKVEPSASTSGLVERLAAACDLAPPPTRLQDAELMSWDELREIARGGGVIGAHTHSHRVLATLDESEQESELATSRDILVREVGGPIRSFAYPVGNYAAFGPQTKQIARRLGFQLGFSFCTGPNPRHAVDPLDVRRSSAGIREHTLGVFAAAATLPAVFS